MIGAMAAPSLLAIPSSGEVTIGRIANTYEQSSGGGEFKITSVGGHFAPFQTFCMELDESITGSRFYTLSDAAIAGGKGGPSPDPISEGTAWLYTQFRQGSLYAFTYDLAHQANAAALQDAIWYLEEEITSIGANAFLAAAIAQFGGEAAAMADYTGTYVKVMNMTDAAGNKKQDFLAVPDGGLTVALLGMGLAGLGWVNRRIRR